MHAEAPDCWPSQILDFGGSDRREQQELRFQYGFAFIIKGIINHNDLVIDYCGISIYIGDLFLDIFGRVPVDDNDGKAHAQSDFKEV